jgi:hypothetical protein
MVGENDKPMTDADLADIEERDATFGDGEHEDADGIARDRAALLTDNRRLRAEVARWREVTGADSPEALDAEAKAIRARARGEPTRGHLVCAVNDAGHDRVEAERARDMAAAQHRQSPTAERTQALSAAQQRFDAAKEDERAARADLAAFEKAHGLTITCREQESA